MEYKLILVSADVHETFPVPEGGLPFKGFRWRKDPALQLNYLWMQVYITRAPEGHLSKVYYDDIVVAKEYIGPIGE